MTSPLASRRTFLALALTMVWPIDDLAVAADRDHAALANGQNGRAVPEVGARAGIAWVDALCSAP